MGAKIQPPLDAHQTMGLTFYQATAISVAGPAATDAITRVNNWTAVNLGGLVKQMVKKARELESSRRIPNHPLPKPFGEMRAFWDENPDDEDVDMADG